MLWNTAQSHCWNDLSSGASDLAICVLWFQVIADALEKAYLLHFKTSHFLRMACGEPYCFRMRDFLSSFGLYLLFVQFVYMAYSSFITGMIRNQLLLPHCHRSTWTNNIITCANSAYLAVWVPPALGTVTVLRMVNWSLIKAVARALRNRSLGFLYGPCMSTFKKAVFGP